MLSSSKKSMLVALALVLFIPVFFLQSKIDPQRAQYEVGVTQTGRAVKQLPIEFALGALTGFREAIAGLLWVRTDDFFDKGDYEAITPMIRIITWLDPHNIDVYETGAWHMDYNFTDTDQRSDRRYIPLSLALMNEGIVNNPDVPEMYSDLAFTHYYRKIADYPKAAETFAAGQQEITDMQQRGIAAPQDAELQDSAKSASETVTTIGHGLAHALEAEGKIPEAEAQWRYVIAQHQNNLNKYSKTDFAEQSGLSISTKQLYEMTQRAKWRPGITKNPIDMHFKVQFVRVAPKIFVVKGTLDALGAPAQNNFLETGQANWQPIDGCRVEVRLQDATYAFKPIPSFSLSSLSLDPNTTIMQEAVSVRKGKVGGDQGRKIDMSQDPQMYSFTAPKYTVTFWFNPADPNDCPPNVQDRIGWLGEGLTGPFLDTSGIIPGDTSAPIPGLKMYKKTITLTREDILGQGEKVFE